MRPELPNFRLVRLAEVFYFIHTEAFDTPFQKFIFCQVNNIHEQRIQVLIGMLARLEHGIRWVKGEHAYVFVTEVSVRNTTILPSFPL